MFAIQEWPEFKRLWGMLVNSNVRFDFTFSHIPTDLLVKRPNQEMWIDNPSGLFRAELNALQQRLWEQGNKLRLNVYCTDGYVTPEGGSPITIKWPLDVQVD